MSSTKADVDPATCSATATAASLAEAIITAFSISRRGNDSPSARYTCEPPMRLAQADATIGSSREAAPSRTRSIAINTVIIFVIDAGGQRLCASCSARHGPAVHVHHEVRNGALGAGRYAHVPAGASARRTPIRSDHPPHHLPPLHAPARPVPRRTQGPSVEIASARGTSRSGSAVDHLPVAVELAVDEQATDVLLATEEGHEALPRETLRQVATRLDQIVPHRPDRRIAGPHEQGPAPVPARPPRYSPALRREEDARRRGSRAIRAAPAPGSRRTAGQRRDGWRAASGCTRRRAAESTGMTFARLVSGKARGPYQRAHTRSTQLA
jgi:hypothetical protein